MTDPQLDDLGRSALHLAARDNDADAVRAGIAAGLEVDLPERRAGYTPLHLAVQDGALDAARALLDAGADVNRHTAEMSLTPLHLAVINGKRSPNGDMVQLLIEHHADRDAVDGIGQRPADVAAGMFRLPPAVRDLISQ
jgi:ankyrin repeat protein